MKLSCTPFSLAQTFREGGMTLQKFIAYCAEQGLDGIDLLDSECYPWSWSSPGDHRHFQEWIRDAGLELAACSCSNNFAITDPERQRAQVELVNRSIERTAAAGAPVLRIFGGYHGAAGGEKDMSTERGIPLVIRGIEGCLEKAAACQVILALENHGQLPGFSHDSRRILDHFNSPWLKATFDAGNYMGHSMPEDENPLDAYDALRGDIAHVHLKDNMLPVFNPDRRREPCVAGQGITPLKAFVERLDADGYGGFGALEYSTTPALPEPDGVTQSLAYLRSISRAGASR